MSILLLLSPALAANFTANTAKWDTANVYCQAYSGTGGIARTSLESGAEPSMTLVNPYTMETVPMGLPSGQLAIELHTLQFHAWSRQVTFVNPKTMQVYAWSQVGFQGQRDTNTDRVEGTANSVACRPR